MIKDKLNNNTTKMEQNNKKLIAIKNAFLRTLPEYTGSVGGSVALTPQTKTVTPTTSPQTVTADTGCSLSSVTVNKIPENYVIPQGDINISENGVYNISGKASATVNVPSAETETKTVDLNLLKGNQEINPSDNKLLSKVTINKPSTLIPENIKKGISIAGIAGICEGGSSTPTTITLNDNTTVLPYPPSALQSMKWFITLSNDSSKYELYASIYGFGYRGSNYKCLTQNDTIDANYAYSYAVYETSASNPTTWVNTGCGTTTISTLAWSPKASNHDIYTFTDNTTKSTIKSPKTTD